MQVEKKEGIDIEEVPPFPSSPEFYNEIPLPPKQDGGGLFSKMKGVFSKRPERIVAESLPPPLPDEQDSLSPEFVQPEVPQPASPIPASPEAVSPGSLLPEAASPEAASPEPISEPEQALPWSTPSPDSKPQVEMPEEPPEPIIADPIPEPKKKEYLGHLRSELTQRIKEINQTPIRNKQAGQLADEISSHKRNLEDLNKELHKINSELSKLNI